MTVMVYDVNKKSNDKNTKRQDFKHPDSILPRNSKFWIYFSLITSKFVLPYKLKINSRA